MAHTDTFYLYPVLSEALAGFFLYNRQRGFVFLSQIKFEIEFNDR